MKKSLITASLLSTVILLGACGNEGSSSENKGSNLKPEKQEEIYSKEAKLLGKAISNEDAMDDSTNKVSDDFKKSLDRYEDKTKNLDSVDTQVGDLTLRVGKSIEIMSERMYELDKFNKDNPDKEMEYNLALVDVGINTAQSLESINEDYESIDVSYKNETIGKKANEEVTDVLSTFPAYELDELIDDYGTGIVGNDETDLTQEQQKVLSDTKYRDELKKEVMTQEEPDTSKNEYNESVNMFNKFAPEFLHYKEVDEMVSSTENNNMMDIRNAVVSANTDAGVDSYEDMEEDAESLEDDTESIEDEESSDDEGYDIDGWSAESYNELVDEYNALTDGEKMDHVDEDVSNIEYEQLEERVAKLEE
ncbi:hypothetical protein UFVDC4_00149 [Staphylococcus phage vB_SauM-UFV_DC4]|nr:hypothetical protein UFVDC4_00149 [Staphylococcus phage vB_SauM-UFV_DC4]